MGRRTDANTVVTTELYLLYLQGSIRGRERMHALGVVHHDAGIVGPQVPRQHGGERDGGRGSERQQKRRGHPAPAAHTTPRHQN